jgi:hypothetical protein
MNNIPAFPQHVCEICSDPIGHMEPQYSGMTLRDYFAGQALIHAANDYQANPEYIADRCYALADAMLAKSIEVEP